MRTLRNSFADPSEGLCHSFPPDLRVVGRKETESVRQVRTAESAQSFPQQPHEPPAHPRSSALFRLAAEVSTRSSDKCVRL